MSEQALAPTELTQRETIITLHPGLLTLCGLALLGAALVWGYTATQRTVLLSVNGVTLTLRTHQRTVGALFDEYHIRLLPADSVQPSLETPLAGVEIVQIRLAQPILIEGDGVRLEQWTQRDSVAGVLQETRIRLGQLDQLTGQGQTVLTSTQLVALQPLPTDLHAARTPVRLKLAQTLPVHINDDGVVFTIYTQASTIQDVLREHAIALHANDRISPALYDAVAAGLHVTIERTKPFTVKVDGKMLPARTREKTIGAALKEAGITLTGKDYAVPPITATLQDQAQVVVKRVREELVEVASPIPFERKQQPDDQLEIDQQKVVQTGRNGELRKQFRVVFEDGAEVQRIQEKEWVARAATPQITAFGRKIVIREVATPNGPLQYWRQVRIYAISYSPARSGTSPDKPWYGRTAGGLKAGKGVSAVDPAVIPWLSKFFVPGYGISIAGDRGGGVRGRMVDLGFDDDNYESWHQWMDIYLLAPPPPPEAITYILPNTPVERQR